MNKILYFPQCKWSILFFWFFDFFDLDRNGLGVFGIIFGSEWDKMYGVCYDDSSQNNIMTDIDKHSQKPYSTSFLTRGGS